MLGNSTFSPKNCPESLRDSVYHRESILFNWLLTVIIICLPSHVHVGILSVHPCFLCAALLTNKQVYNTCVYTLYICKNKVKHFTSASLTRNNWTMSTRSTRQLNKHSLQMLYNKYLCEYKKGCKYVPHGHWHVPCMHKCTQGSHQCEWISAELYSTTYFDNSTISQHTIVQDADSYLRTRPRDVGYISASGCDCRDALADFIRLQKTHHIWCCPWGVSKCNTSHIIRRFEDTFFKAIDCTLNSK